MLASFGPNLTPYCFCLICKINILTLLSNVMAVKPGSMAEIRGKKPRQSREESLLTHDITRVKCQNHYPNKS